MKRRHGVGLLTAILAMTPQAGAAVPLLSEIFYDATGSDNGKSFVELWGAPGTILDGFTLEGVNGAGGGIGPTVALSGSIPLDGFFVLADDSGDGTTTVSGADLIANFDFQNGPDSVVLRDGGGTAVDAVGYGDFDPGEVFAGEGSPAPDAPADSSLARVFANVDTDDNALDFQVLAMPTPGTGALSEVPEPATATLLGAGVALLAVAGRRRPL